MGNVVYAILIAAGLVGLTAWLYKANHDTPVPAGCENLKPDCAGSFSRKNTRASSITCEDSG